jgi:hypothetical protein
MGVPVTAFPDTLTNIRSAAPFRNSVIGEHSPSTVVTEGPRTGVPMPPLVMGIFHSTSSSYSYFPAPLVGLDATTREDRKAAITNISSALSLATTGFIWAVHSPVRNPCCMS